MRIHGLLLVGGIAGVIAGFAQSKPQARAFARADVTAPALGFVAGHPAAELRPVLGLKAFPALGSPVELPVEARRVLLSPGEEYALAATSDGWKILPVRDSGTAEATLIEEPAKLAAISPSGRAAAFYLHDAEKVVVIADLPRRPRVAFESETRGAVTCLAVADSADAVLAGGDGTVLLLRPGQPPSAALQAGAPSAIAFLRNSSRALVADREWNQIVSIELTESGADANVIAGTDHLLDAPSGLAIDDASETVLVLNGRSILALSLADGSVQRIGCDFQPVHIAPLGDDRVFAVRSAEDAGAWVLRIDGPEPRMLYAPAVD